MLPNGTFGTYDKRHRFAFAGMRTIIMKPGGKRLIATGERLEKSVLPRATTCVSPYGPAIRSVKTANPPTMCSSVVRQLARAPQHALARTFAGKGYWKINAI